MDMLTADGRRIVEDVARRHGISPEAVLAVLLALVDGQGTQAQFSHPDLGGMGQWSQGGMIMVGDMFNHGLKARVDALCTELAGLLRTTDLLAQPQPRQSQSQSQGGPGGVSLFVPGARSSGAWWPADLGSPASVGGQNDLRYAFFPAARRLAIDLAGQVAVYDTGDHAIGGFSQQQGGDQSLTFTSQHGTVRVADLPVVTGARVQASGQPVRTSPAATEPASTVPAPAAKPARAEEDIFAKLERLADLRQKNILTEQEFETKKADLLSRL